MLPLCSSKAAREHGTHNTNADTETHIRFISALYPLCFGWRRIGHTLIISITAQIKLPFEKKLIVHDRNRAQAVDQEVALLVRVILPTQDVIDELNVDPLDELEGLAKTAGAVVAGGMTQRRERPDITTFLGKGKVDELINLVEFHAADVVIFDNDLSPAQVRNLEQATKVKVLDRTELILDIFATRAQTHEARLAVELAQLEYSLPRLKRMWTHLSRLKMGVGMRGPGEKQLEVDRRLVEKRIHDLKTELKQVEKRKEQQVRSRRGTMTVSLVGYTNAGKSTLMNALTEALSLIHI